MKTILLLISTLLVPTAHAQWQILDSHTTADLSGVYAVDNRIAWASGSHGTILRTEDGGSTWQACAVPAEAANLNFSNIQAFDNKAAVVMSSGKGKLSRLYKTTDGCRTWKTVLDNPNADSSFESLRRVTGFAMYLVGNPVNGKFAVFVSNNAGDTWSISDDPGLALPKGVDTSVGGSASLTNILSVMAFGTNGQHASVYTLSPSCRADKCSVGWATGRGVPIAQTGSKAGVYSVAGRNLMVAGRALVTGTGTEPATALIAVGGDPEKPAQGTGTAAFSADDGVTWRAAATPPQGFRSAVDFDGEDERYIAVGPNGTDETVDEGLIWQALKPGPGDAPDADKHWTSLSLPFVVGPNGRIGRIEDTSKGLTVMR